MSIKTRTLVASDIEVCDAINRGLPQWFGIEEGLAEALQYLHQHEGIVAEANGEVVGYLTWHQHFGESAEISWMAVAATAHREGVGRALIAALLAQLPASITLLSVKTLADSHPSPEYGITRAFYRSCGFQPLMVLPDLWDEANPCLIMVKFTGS